jgi:nitrilase
MTVLATVRVAAIQATPVVLDASGSVDKAVDLIADAAAEGVEMVVFPESFVAMYPSWVWAGAALNDDDVIDEIFLRLWESSVDVPGPLVDQLIDACRRHRVHCVIGVNEREPDRSFSVYNTMVTLGPTGLLARHRKLVPTSHERLFHAFGAGDDLAVVQTAVGRVGGLICWENRMPLARYAVYRGAPQIYAAPTADTSPGWTSLMRAIAIESGAFVVSANQYVPASAYPSDFPIALPADEEVISAGGSCIIPAYGDDALAGPLYGEEGMLVADCNLRDCFADKRSFDVTGHYSREEILVPLLSNGGPARRQPTATPHAPQ